MNLKLLKITISLLCGVFVAVHLFVPAIDIDAITLGLIALGLLPWFQPLVKSLELPGGLKIELQDVKAATDKISRGPKIQPLDASAQKTGALPFISKVAEQDPNLALVGLRIELEKQLVEIAEAVGVSTERRGIGALLRELNRLSLIPQTVAAGLQDFLYLGNQAAHGATVSRDAANWALDSTPQLLGILSALRSNLNEFVTQTGEIPKAQILASLEKKSPIPVRFAQPFVTVPNVIIGFYRSADTEHDSGSLQVTKVDEQGFIVDVISMPQSHRVVSWSVKWQAIGKAGSRICN